ncbi:hypothetical protein BpHYR1_053019 [Brachionus plicatilis]|uniref:Uncharacterized protein n=1 Tax=Brachionus plicatilis TaxID=10195 RepID=A0A3M7SA44_BRAPC|nr:hypothetical protein BpHYR1_053019 [Brachionus plicatilis]
MALTKICFILNVYSKLKFKKEFVCMIPNCSIKFLHFSAFKMMHVFDRCLDAKIVKLLSLSDIDCFFNK